MNGLGNYLWCSSVDNHDSMVGWSLYGNKFGALVKAQLQGLPVTTNDTVATWS